MSGGEAEFFYQGNLVLSGVVFALGALGFLWKRDAIGMFLCIELMLNAANLALVTFAQAFGQAQGIAAFIFVLTVAAAEAGVGLALFIKVFIEKSTIQSARLNLLRD